MKLLFIGGKMHMKMLHGCEQVDVDEGLTLHGESYRHAGQIIEGVQAMGRPEDFYTPQFKDWSDEAKRLLSDPDLFKGPRALGGRKLMKHESEHSYTTNEVVEILKREHEKIRKERKL